MVPYTYAVGDFLTVESDVEVFLFDTPTQEPVPDPDIVLRTTDSEELGVEWTGDGVRIAVPSSLPVEKTRSTEPVRFTKLLVSALQGMLLWQGATLAFGSALRTPDGAGVGLFGPSDCGKSTTAFHLARQRGYRLLADDLLVCDGGRVYPFPRYLNLPRDVPVVERWVQSDEVPADRIRLWPNEVDVPRRLVSETVPERVELDYVLLLAPRDSPVEAPEAASTEAVSSERAGTVLAALHQSALAGWTAHPAVRDTIGDGGTDQGAVVQEAIAGATCYRLEASQADFPQSVATIVEPSRTTGDAPPN